MKYLKRSKRGFTLIELLVVIALIGALIVGLLAALDPVEQISRGQDVTTQKLVGDYIAAQERAYATLNGSYAGTIVDGTLLNAAAADAMITALQDSGEVKASFSTQADNAAIGGRITIVDQDSATQTLSVAYEVKSKSYKTNPNIPAANRCTTASGACTTCTAASTTCYVRTRN